MKFTRILLIVFLAAVALVSCKTTEENYRKAYERTVAARAEQDSIDQTIYGRERHNMTEHSVSTPAGEVKVKSQFVRVTDGGGGIPESLRRYNVVAGQFKQIFNAKSFRERLADGGYPSAFVVETAEPYYYIVVGSFSDVQQAQAQLEKLAKDKSVTVKPPCPFILDATARRSPARNNHK